MFNQRLQHVTIAFASPCFRASVVPSSVGGAWLAISLSDLARHGRQQRPQRAETPIDMHRVLQEEDKV